MHTILYLKTNRPLIFGWYSKYYFDAWAPTSVLFLFEHPQILRARAATVISRIILRKRFAFKNTDGQSDRLKPKMILETQNFVFDLCKLSNFECTWFWNNLIILLYSEASRDQKDQWASEFFQKWSSGFLIKMSF